MIWVGPTPDPTIAQYTAILNRPMLANVLQLLHGSFGSNALWGFYVKDDDFYLPSNSGVQDAKEVDALQQMYGQLKVSFPDLPVIAGYGTNGEIKNTYAPGLTDVVLIYNYPWSLPGIGGSETNQFNSFKSEINQETSNLIRIGGPQTTWIGMFQAFSNTSFSPTFFTTANADEMLKQNQVYMQYGSAGISVFDSSAWNSIQMYQNATHAFELATQTHWGTLSATTSGASSVSLQGSYDALDLPGGLTGTINGPGASNSPLTVTPSDPNWLMQYGRAHSKVAPTRSPSTIPIGSPR